MMYHMFPVGMLLFQHGIIQTAMKGWTGKEDVLRELPGRGIYIVQRSPPEDFSTAVKTKVGSTLGNWASCAPNRGNRSSNVENKIASMRFLSRRKSFPYKIICCMILVFLDLRMKFMFVVKVRGIRKNDSKLRSSIR